MARASAHTDLPRKLEVLTKARAYCKASNKRGHNRLDYVNRKLQEANLEPVANLNALRKQFSILNQQKRTVKAKVKKKAQKSEGC